jgi:protein SCO1
MFAPTLQRLGKIGLGLTLTRYPVSRRSALMSAAFGLSALIVYRCFSYGGAKQTSLDVSSTGTPFRLMASDGTVVDSADLIGKPFGVFFGFTHCPQVCPTTLDEMTRALQGLGGEAEDFRLYFVTVDPERDTASVLKDYVSNFDPRIKALIPTPEELPRVARVFRAFYEKVPTSDGGYTMNHTASIYLMGQDGKLASTIGFEDSLDARIQKLRGLLARG